MSTCTDPSCRLLAAQYLRKQGKQLLAQLPGVRQATDVEFLHRARVASRRLRAALGIFGDCLPQKPLKRWNQGIRRVTKGLSAARDLDVQRDYLVEVLTQLEDPLHYPGMAHLLVRTDLQRDRTQRKVLKSLRRLQNSRILEDMRRALKAVSVKQHEENLLQTAACFRMAEHHIGQRLDEMLSLEDSLEDPNDCQQHHAMRIAAKWLRYTMEICRPVYGESIDAALEAVKRLQSLLGEVHDCDVWIAQLPCMLEEERHWIVECYGHAGPLERLNPAVDYLIARRQQSRQERFAELTQFWHEHSGRGTWTQLLQMLQRPEAPSAGEVPQEGSDAKQPAVELPSIGLPYRQEPQTPSPSASHPHSSTPTDGNGTPQQRSHATEPKSP